MTAHGAVARRRRPRRDRRADHRAARSQGARGDPRRSSSMLPRLLEVAKFPPRVHGGDAGVPGGRLARRRDRSRQAADHHTAGPRTAAAYITLPMVITQRSEARHSQRRDVPRAGAREGHARDALAAAQGGRGALARDGGARREDAGRASRSARDPAVGLFGVARRCRPTIDEFLFAGFLRQAPGVSSRRRVTCDLEVPADAEFVIEGYIDPARAARDRGAVRRSHRILFAGRSVSAGARHRDHDAARSRSTRRRSSAVRRWRTTTSATRPSGSSCRCSSSRCPEIVDYHMPAEGIFHNLVFVSIDKQYPGPGVQGDERAVGRRG